MIPKHLSNSAVKDIENYLMLSNPPGIILQGIPGLGKGLAAKYIAARLLNCKETDLMENVDYYQTSKDTPLKVDDVENLIEKSLTHSMGDRKVLTIFNAHTISQATQNRLLKLLEDNSTKNTLILLSEKDSLLKTIKSRCYTILFTPLDTLSMKQYLKTTELDERHSDFVCYLTENAPYLIDDNLTKLNDYISFYDKLSAIADRKNLLPLFNILKEKDSMEFYSQHTDYPAWNIRLLLYPFYQLITEEISNNFPKNFYNKKQALQVMEHGLTHLHMLDSGYTKNDYFNLVRFIIQVN